MSVYWTIAHNWGKPTLWRDIVSIGKSRQTNSTGKSLRLQRKKKRLRTPSIRGNNLFLHWLKMLSRVLYFIWIQNYENRRLFMAASLYIQGATKVTPFFFNFRAEVNGTTWSSWAAITITWPNTIRPFLVLYTEISCLQVQPNQFLNYNKQYMIDFIKLM